jgi:cell division protein FtsI (penicillin-binding protein 3)
MDDLTQTFKPLDWQIKKSWKFSKLADPRLQSTYVPYKQYNQRQRISKAQNRLVVTCSLLILCMMAIFLRLTEVILWKGTAQIRTTSPVDTNLPIVKRADIVDRNGVILATSLPTYSLYANPREMLDRKDAVEKLMRVFPDLDYQQLLSRLNSDRSFVWVKRNLSPAQSQIVWRLGIPGLQFIQEEKRGYPLGSLLAHVVGFADVDNKGLSGIERSFDEYLTNSTDPLRLSIDIRLQHIIRQELIETIKQFTAVGGVGVLMDIRTGEILAMVSLPDFDPNNPANATSDELFNRPILGVYEMGSTFKIFNTALAIDSGVVRITDQFDAQGPLHVGGFKIHDFNPINRLLTVPEIMLHSSNIASARMAMKVGTERQKIFLEKLGLLDPVSVELMETAKPLYPKTWRDINTMTIAYGHGIAVTPLHLIVGVSAIVNDGKYYAPTLIARSSRNINVIRQIISPQTSRQVRDIMRLVVEKGTGKKADVAGYYVGGKTGTAEKQVAGLYQKDARLASFVSVFPIYEPRYVLLVMVDEPKPNASSQGFATGGWVAAPTAGRIIQRIAPVLNILPTEKLPLLTSDNYATSQTGLVNLNGEE